MKLMIALMTAIFAGALIGGSFLFFEKARWPSADFLTQALRRGAEKLLAMNWPPVSRYQRHLIRLLNEVPLPDGVDVPLFLAWHAVAGPLPYLWLRHRQSQFHAALLKALPECLELQALVMEAGLDLTAGLQHYLAKGAPNPLQNLLKGVQGEIQMGTSRLTAYARLSRRTTYPPLRDVCRTLVQGLSLGTQMAPLLREQAASLRLRRMQIAEKKAAEAPIKVLFPLFVFIFPTIFMILLGPMAILFMKGGF
ncbi:MAG: hypothetical protein A2992_02580 [Elusimicrobia bacterium RIFCSPLOWO2_01_FULL_59_12]|nr:MAG: hypothetical protein A2992_02580 [Elusimicrobia bacterium RIFCSPLOWO2_01_FULL_59_12]